MADDKGARQQLRRSAAGHLLLDELYQAEMRGIVRAHLADDAHSLRGTAKEIGITLYRLDCFLAGQEMIGESFERIARWCEGKPTPFIQAESVALGILCRWLNRKVDLYEGRQEVAAAVRQLYERRNVRLPAYVMSALDAA